MIRNREEIGEEQMGKREQVRSRGKRGNRFEGRRGNT
jgi:hypothetical protein